jgi:hypothetical protein
MNNKLEKSDYGYEKKSNETTQKTTKAQRKRRSSTRQRETDCLFSRRSLQNLKTSHSKKGANYVTRKSKHKSTFELERGVVHQLPHDIRQQR